MTLIVAVYDNWGIGCGGTQPVALSADRKFFRRMTAGSTVIVGRKTLMDFPGSAPLPKRKNIVLSRKTGEISGAIVCRSPEEAVREASEDEKVFVIGGGTVYEQMLPFCDMAYVTKVHTLVQCDTYFHNLDQDSCWEADSVLESGVENNISYEMIRYKRV